MAIDVTPGSATAVAYDTAANADSYFTARGITAWTGTEAAKEAALVRGADYLDRTYALRWIGLRAEDAQALDWPRSDAVDLDGYPYEVDEIPTALKQANFEAALLVLTGTDLEPVLVRGGAVRRTRAKAGPAESETEYSAGAPARSRFTALEGALAPLLLQNAIGGGVMLGRV